MEELQLGSRAMHDVEDLSSGTLRLGFTPSFGIYLLGPLIREYRDRFPGIVLTVTEMSQEDIERALCADTMDVGLAFSEILKEEVEWLPLHEERVALIVDQAHRSGLRVVPLTPLFESRRVALLRRRGAYRSAASRAFVAVSEDCVRQISGSYTNPR